MTSLASSTRAPSSREFPAGRVDLPATAPIGSAAPAHLTHMGSADLEGADGTYHDEHVKVNVPVAIGLLTVSTALAYLTAEALVESINGLAETSTVSKEWLTLIVIPIISNAAEHATAVVVATKGKFDLALSVAVGSCIQIALFVIPTLVLVAWGLGKPLTLLFDSLETIVRLAYPFHLHMFNPLGTVPLPFRCAR
jgi:Ca2+:H+ antiporter